MKEEFEDFKIWFSLFKAMNLEEKIKEIKHILGIRRCCYFCSHAQYSWEYEKGYNDWYCEVTGDEVDYNELEHACKEFKRGTPQDITYEMHPGLKGD